MAHPSAFQPGSQPLKRQLQVVVHAGPLAGKGFPLTGNTLTFGRDPDNDISLDDEQVSRHHARLLRQGDQIILEDFGSTNGTLVNGKPVMGQHVLQPADIISIGSSVFGVKGFAAPQTVGLTQLSMEPPPYMPPLQPPLTPPPPSSPIIPYAPAHPAEAAPSRLTLVAIGGVLALVITILIMAAITAYYVMQGRNPAVADIPTAVITAPVNNSQVRVNQPVTLQATASSPSGVTRLELWVSGVKLSEVPAQGQVTFTASFQWTPTASGSYTLEIKAYNTAGAVNVPTLVTVNAIVEGGPTATPTVTPLPGTPTATVPSGPALITRADLNVRNGPGTQYILLGLFPTGTAADIIGRDDTRQWWQVRFAPAPDGLGWVSADPAYAQAFNVQNIPVVAAPPTPTGTPTNTPPPPTNTPTTTTTPTGTPLPSTPTPTPTLLPPTNTPTNTATPGQGTVIEFNISPMSVEGGQCVLLSWNITGVKEIYINEVGVAGSGQTEDCPKETQTYHLRVKKQDDSEYTKEITVEVINPIIFSGSMTLTPNQTVDLEAGISPGDDFMWKIDGGSRKFEALAGVKIAPMRPINALKELTLAECASAPFGVYTFIDASDSIADPNNALVAGRSACFTTNQGRLGKLRFPDKSTDTLKIEWLTWK